MGALHIKLLIDTRKVNEISENESALEQDNISLESTDAKETNKALPEKWEDNQEIKRIDSFKRWQSAAHYTKGQIMRTVMCPLNITMRSLLMILVNTSASGMLI